MTREIVGCALHTGSIVTCLLLATMLAGCTGLRERVGANNHSPVRAADGFVSLFDGKTLAGWEGSNEVFRIEDGAVVGGTLSAKVAHNDFLCTIASYDDFELRLQCKLLGENANAGIQIRSRRVPDHYEVSGYQADMGQQYWGCLYDESRRNKVLACPDPAKIAEVVRVGGWNDYVIRCEGKRIQLWLNGLQTVDYTEPDDAIPQSGVIGLQIHGGPPSEAWYRNIRIRPL
ncbi:MAG: DUF1080 domain-containing protein [Sedimentisphaerales bacterium]|nr:DUF1080 domain-containing protein [Sedimentisphaerales bacterium]HNY76972.1 DUF1080 domain-containing protein [Sedimentisphaerales bacterium]HOC64695.1 DUF1080 domain-containing protein [Sedimentisphaerales bacterium]HOH62746.1 DUF1080 domain-containing protein [Sedimentisphaerales bacterium]HPY48476.1 DUF1080 domain-containing protein [Sedimentisphaerales bacterium]